jgi:hypothetical protein
LKYCQLAFDSPLRSRYGGARQVQAYNNKLRQTTVLFQPAINVYIYLLLR